jgi:hypothetical protein
VIAMTRTQFGAFRFKLASGLLAALLLSACASTGHPSSALPYEAAAEPTTRQTVCRIWGNADDASYCAPAAIGTEVSRRN